MVDEDSRRRFLEYLNSNRESRMLFNDFCDGFHEFWEHNVTHGEIIESILGDKCNSRLEQVTRVFLERGIRNPHKRFAIVDHQELFARLLSLGLSDDWFRDRMSEVPVIDGLVQEPGTRVVYPDKRPDAFGLALYLVQVMSMLDDDSEYDELERLVRDDPGLLGYVTLGGRVLHDNDEGIKRMCVLADSLRTGALSSDYPENVSFLEFVGACRTVRDQFGTRDLCEAWTVMDVLDDYYMDRSGRADDHMWSLGLIGFMVTRVRNHDDYGMIEIMMIGSLIADDMAAYASHGRPRGSLFMMGNDYYDDLDKAELSLRGTSLPLPMVMENAIMGDYMVRSTS